MPYRPSTHRLRNVLGWIWLTPFEWALALLIGWIVVEGAIPRYEAWRAEQRLQSERETVIRVRAALVMPGGGRVHCPAELDSCSNGPSGPGRVFFSAVLPDDEPLDGWSKYLGCYRGPAGGWYRYDPAKCEFLRTTRPINPR